jgi:hypothetical protein
MALPYFKLVTPKSGGVNRVKPPVRKYDAVIC